MKDLYQVYYKRWLAIVTVFLLLPLILYSRLYFLRPPSTNEERILFEGIVYQRQVYSTPRPQIIHLIAVDLTKPGVRVLVTPAKATVDYEQPQARTTSEFVREFQVQLAMNANFFFPFRENTPWDYYPHSGDGVNLVGQAISNGTQYSSAERSWPVLCFLNDNRAQILESGDCPQETQMATAGNQVLLKDGTPVRLAQSSGKDKPYGRAAVALNEDGYKLWLIVVDGKQPFYSEGVTMAELTEIVKELGAHTALNLDGGGSSTLVMATPNGSTLLNSPIHNKLPMNERPIANHLGFYANAYQAPTIPLSSSKGLPSPEG
ncbi:MAG: phosphodiester glycosidase family protein [Merismopedia sp. SIO2A8]|nr:phosphodiester glycosidase family protein [Symploca sp. SIO2B6]NET53412.1 phosphodiester glycosidase family protein [Merismopedia sp. SIO2A8]